MNTSTALYTRLTTYAPLVAVVGLKVFPVTIPQGTAAPYIIYQQIGSDPANTHTSGTGAIGRAFQFACFAASYEAARALRDLIIEALDTDGVIPLANGESATLTDERDGDYDDAVNLYRADCDFSV